MAAHEAESSSSMAESNSTSARDHPSLQVTIETTSGNVKPSVIAGPNFCVLTTLGDIHSFYTFRSIFVDELGIG